MQGLRVGILANEFFDPEHGGIGGFGWAAKRAAETLIEKAPFVRKVTFLAPAAYAGPPALHGIPVRALARSGYSSRVRIENIVRHALDPIDVILSIDYRPNYTAWYLARPRTPVIVWSRDPKTSEDWERIDTLRIPGRLDAVPGGTHRINTASLGRFVSRTRRFGRPVLVASKMSYLAAKTPGAYGLESMPHVLCNPGVVDYDAVRVQKAERPLVVFLARLDPIKRPWLFLDVARKIPDADFVMMGQNHFSGDAAWTPADVPPNLRFAGHVSGQDKLDLLSAAWLLVNTSIHEEAPTSLFEGFAYEAPAVSTVDSGDTVARYGTFVGRSPGDGIEAMPRLVKAVRDLLQDDARRQALGTAAREYVESEHTAERFVEQFRSLCVQVGRLPA